MKPLHVNNKPVAPQPPISNKEEPDDTKIEDHLQRYSDHQTNGLLYWNVLFLFQIWIRERDIEINSSWASSSKLAYRIHYILNAEFYMSLYLKADISVTGLQIRHFRSDWGLIHQLFSQTQQAFKLVLWTIWLVEI